MSPAFQTPGPVQGASGSSRVPQGFVPGEATQNTRPRALQLWVLWVVPAPCVPLAVRGCRHPITDKSFSVAPPTLGPHLAHLSKPTAPTTSRPLNHIDSSERAQQNLRCRAGAPPIARHGLCCALLCCTSQACFFSKAHTTARARPPCLAPCAEHTQSHRPPEACVEAGRRQKSSVLRASLGAEVLARRRTQACRCGVGAWCVGVCVRACVRVHSRSLRLAACGIRAAAQRRSE